MPSASPARMRVRSPAGVRLVMQLDPQRPVAGEGGLVGDGQAAEHVAHRQAVLLGQHLGRGHERALVAALDGHEQGGDGHQRLARAHVALEQPVHGVDAGQVAGDLGDGPLLGAGERERQRRRGSAAPARRRPTWRMPLDSRSTARLRMTRASCSRSSSSTTSRRRAAWAAAIDSGLWIERNAHVRSTTSSRSRHSSGSGSAMGPARASASSMKAASSHVARPAFSDCG